jgi:hypothetical protein
VLRFIAPSPDWPDSVARNSDQVSIVRSAKIEGMKKWPAAVSTIKCLGILSVYFAGAPP